MRTWIRVLVVNASCLLATAALAGWTEQEVRQLNGRARTVRLKAQAQLVSEHWGRSVQMPYLVYMPEKDELLMLFLSERPTRAMLSGSRDGGQTWSAPRYMHVDPTGKPDTAGATSLTYLGAGTAMLVVGEGTTDWNWLSSDFGQSWRKVARPPAFPGTPFYVWDPFFVEREAGTGRVARMAETGYISVGKWEEGGYSQGVIRFSTEAGRTWGQTTKVPQWRGWNEIVVARAANGDLVAACRSDAPQRFHRFLYDNYSGLGVSVSQDGGNTWSEVKTLFEWGRHHPSMVVLPGGEMVMTYVVRRGYPDTPDGFPQMGIEAVVSRDHGRTWDLDHRYLLVTWTGRAKGPDGPYITQSQSTSSVLLPDGSILTSYGGAQRAVRTVPGGSDPRDVGLVRWSLNRASLNSARNIARAPFDSNLRNRLDLNRLEGTKSVVSAVAGRSNIATVAEGVRVTSSPGDQKPAVILHDEYGWNLLTLQTMPAWIELRWAKPRRIEEIRIHPGAPAVARQPSTECVPSDYRLQYQKGPEWIDLAPPVTNARRYKEFDSKQRVPYILEKEFEYVHTFRPVRTKAIRMTITRSSDEGKRAGSRDGAVIEEARRETVLREIEVFEAKE